MMRKSKIKSSKCSIYETLWGTKGNKRSTSNTGTRNQIINLLWLLWKQGDYKQDIDIPNSDVFFLPFSSFFFSLFMCFCFWMIPLIKPVFFTHSHELTSNAKPRPLFFSFFFFFTRSKLAFLVFNQNKIAKWIKRFYKERKKEKGRIDPL